MLLLRAWPALSRLPGSKRACACVRAAASMPALPEGQEPGGAPRVLHYGPLAPGKLVKRYKRFLADVQVEAEGGPAEVTAHCPNTGPMTGLLDWPLAPCWVSTSDNAKRKHARTLEVVRASEGGPWVNVHSASANAQVRAIIEQRLVPELAGYASFRPEVKYGQDGGSRIDFLLTDAAGGLTYVEVKSVTLSEDLPGPAGSPAQERPRRIGLWPDALSERGQKHVRELMGVAAAGHGALCVFLLQRHDCQLFAPAFEKDPAYARLLVEAHGKGVGIVAIATRPCPQREGGYAEFVGTVPVDLTHKADYVPPTKERKPRKRKAPASKGSEAAPPPQELL